MLAYARMLLGRAAGGGGGGMDTQAVTAGSSGSALHQTRRIGYVQAGNGFGNALGSIDDGASDLYANAPILALYWDEGGGDDAFIFCVSGIQLNVGWTRMVINGGTTLLRAAADFSNVSNTIWSWPGTGNIFGGGVSTVVFS